MASEIRVGTAGWSVPPQLAGEFPETGTHLERYARRLAAVEINSSFYRPHRPATYERWARSVPDDFRFSVKVPKEITHARRLVGAAEPLSRFLAEIRALGAKLGPLLVQLPPSLPYEESIAASFFEDLQTRFRGHVACEPRHSSWFDGAADALLGRFEAARVAADPARVPRAAVPGGWPGLVYHRLHGSPQVYHSGYGPAYVDALARGLAEAAAPERAVWCIFDNTARGEAAADALGLLRAQGLCAGRPGVGSACADPARRPPHG